MRMCRKPHEYAEPRPVHDVPSTGGKMTALEIHPTAASTVPVTSVAHKFGGSSLADATRMRHVANLIRSRPEATQVVVVSAMQGVTDALLALTSEAASGQPWREKLDVLRTRHLDTARELLGEHATPACAWLDARFDELAATLNAITVLRGAGAGVAEATS